MIIFYIFVPQYLPDLSYGGPTISVASLSTVLRKMIAIDHYVLSNTDSNRKNKHLPFSRKSNILGQIYFLLSDLHANKSNKCIIFLNSFFHKQSFFAYIALVMYSIIFSSLNISILIAPRGELMSRGQSARSFKTILKFYLFRLFIAVEGKINFLYTSLHF